MLPLGIAIQLKDQFTRTANQVGLSQRKLEKSTDTMAKKMRRSMNMVRGGFVAMIVGLGIAAAFTPAILAASAFNEKIAESSTIFQGTAEEMAFLEDRVKSLSATYGQAPTDQAAALYQTISAGFADASDAALVMNTANRLAVAGVTDVATAFEGLVAAMKPFQLGAEESERVANSLFLTVRSGITTIPELSGVLGRVGPFAAQARVELEEMASAMAAITSATKLSSAEVSTQLRSLFTAIQEGAKTSKMLKDQFDLSVKFDVEAIKDQGLIGTLMAVRKEIDKLGEAQQGLALKTLLGREEAIAAFSVLTTSGLNTFTDSMVAMREEAAALDGGFRKMSNSLAFQGRKLRSSLSLLAIEVGTSLEPVLMLLVGGLTKMVSGVTSLVKAFPRLTAAVSTFIFTAGLLIAGGGGIIAVLGAVQTALPLITAAVTKLAAGSGVIAGIVGFLASASLGTILAVVAGIAAAIALLIGYLILLKKLWDKDFMGSRTRFEGFVDRIKTVFAAVQSVMDTLEGSIGSITKSTEEKLKQWNLYDTFLALTAIAYRLRQFIEGVGEGFKEVAGPAFAVLRASIDQAWEAVGALWDALAPVINAVLRLFGQSDDVKSFGELVGKALGWIVAGILTPLLIGINALAQLIEWTTALIQTKVIPVLRFLKAAISGNVDSMKDALSSWQNFLSPMLRGLLTLGGAVISHVVVPFQKARDTIAGLISDAVALLDKVPGIDKVMPDAGFLRGVAAAVPAVGPAMAVTSQVRRWSPHEALTAPEAAREEARRQREDDRDRRDAERQDDLRDYLSRQDIHVHTELDGNEVAHNVVRRQERKRGRSF